MAGSFGRIGKDDIGATVMLTVCVSTHYGTFVLPLYHFLAYLPLITFNPNDPNAHLPIHSQPPNFQPTFTAPTEQLARMTARAGEVIRLLEVLRNDTPIFPSSLLSSTSTSSFA